VAAQSRDYVLARFTDHSDHTLNVCFIFVAGAGRRRGEENISDAGLSGSCPRQPMPAPFTSREI
jgi:hypothetical protein